MLGGGKSQIKYLKNENWGDLEESLVPIFSCPIILACKTQLWLPNYGIIFRRKKEKLSK
jgi:hypothetical protein